MTLLRNFLYVTAAAALAMLPACSTTEATDDPASGADELNASLKSLTVLKGKLTEGSAVTVTYEPSAYEQTKEVPFLGVQLVRAPAPGANTGLRAMNGEMQLSVNVHGDFPGLPHVLVVDEQFHVLASGDGVTTENGTEAVLMFPDVPGDKMILVRDQLWVRPMDFEIRAGR